MTSNLADRFLHVCYNCAIEEIDPTVARFETALGLTTVMRSPTTISDGALLGFATPIETAAAFLYDARGPRSSPAIEVQGWSKPCVVEWPASDAEIVGIHALGFVVDDVSQACDDLVRSGCVRTTASASSGGRAALRLRDLQGVGIELVARDDVVSGQGCRLSYVLVLCSELAVSAQWYQRFGFTVVEHLIGPDGDPLSVRLSLAANDLELRLVQSTGSATRTSNSAPGNRRGLFRFATRVESVDAATAELKSRGILVVAGPTSVAIAGTSLPPLIIAIVRDPDGIPYELVERPASAFR